MTLIVEYPNRIKTMNNKIPNIIYYNDDHSQSHKCTDEMTNLMGATYTLAGTWAELVADIEVGECNIVFHIDMITKSDITIKNFVDSINTIIDFIPNHKPLRLVVLITPNTPRHKINELKEADVFGIGLDFNYYPIEEVVKCMKDLSSGIRCWPEHIINQLPDSEKKPVYVSFRPKEEQDKVFLYYLERKHIIDKLGLDIRFCTNWEELGEVLKEDPCVVTAHIGMIDRNGITIYEFISMVETLAKLTSTKKIPIGIIIENTTPLKVVKELQKANILGIGMSYSSFDFNEVYRSVEALANQIPYWPKHILDQLPGAKQTVTKNTIKLTTRQAQIVNLISERGLTNKKIAQALNITESTVKIHVSAILKAYGVRTRTQLALAAIR